MDPILEAKYKEKLFTQVRPNSTAGSFLHCMCFLRVFWAKKEVRKRHFRYVDFLSQLSWRNSFVVKFYADTWKLIPHTDCKCADLKFPTSKNVFACDKNRNLAPVPILSASFCYNKCSHSTLPRYVNSRELKQGRRQRQRRRQEAMIWSVEWRRIIVLHVRQAL